MASIYHVPMTEVASEGGDTEHCHEISCLAATYFGHFDYVLSATFSAAETRRAATRTVL